LARQSVRSLCLRPAFASARSGGTSSFGTGSALTRAVQGTGASTMKLSYRRPVMMVADGVNDAPALPWPISAPRWEGGAAASAEAA
jgi:hypothetical protein